jgi:hypothetical protein
MAKPAPSPSASRADEEQGDAVNGAGRRVFGPDPLFQTIDAMGGNPHDGAKVVAKMKEAPTTLAVRQGHDPRRRPQASSGLSVRGQKPSRSKGPWDYYKLVGTTGRPGVPPLSESACRC